MSEKPSIDISDVLRAMAGGGGPSPSEPEASPVESTVLSTGSVIDDLGGLVGPTPELLDLAHNAAHAQDEAQEANAKASVLKAALHEAMLAQKLTEVPMNDREPVKLGTRNERAKTLTALKEVEGVEHWNAKKAQEVWDKLPVKSKPKLEIPMPRIVAPDEQT